MYKTDILIVGGGVIGISIAWEIKKRYKDSSVTLIEKEAQCAEHTSGRNSGVLHAGFYYTADSLKAAFSRDGNRELTEYCEAQKIAINKCGKLVVARNQKDLAGLDELFNRAKANSVLLENITADEARSVEPRAITFKRALFSPTTSSVNPLQVVQSLEREAQREGVVFHYQVRYLGRKDNRVITSSGDYQAGYVVNAAGLYADQVAQDFGFSKQYRILPFKGLYLYSNEPVGSFRTNIYPVPDLSRPFLGVHFTLGLDNKIKIGPTAIPAFWREHYNGFDNFQFKEFVEIVYRELGLLTFSNFGFRSLAFEELHKYSRKYMVSLAARLASNIRIGDYTKWGKPGIRAQLIDIRNRKLEMDFVIEGDNHSMHVLNAVSPAFTCCLPFSRYVCDQIQDKLSS